LYAETVLILVLALTPAAASAKSPRAIFGRHDPQHRIAHTTIRRIANFRAAHTRYVAYYLDFTNPESHPGMQHIATIRNGRDFVGAANCDANMEDVRWGGNRLWIERQDLRADGLQCWRDDPYRQAMHFTPKGVRVDKYFCGDENVWSDGI
jgi:hypothetical protein